MKVCKNCNMTFGDEQDVCTNCQGVLEQVEQVEQVEQQEEVMAQTEVQKKGSKKGLVIAIIVVVVAALLVAAYFIFFGCKKSAKQIEEELSEAFENTFGAESYTMTVSAAYKENGKSEGEIASDEKVAATVYYQNEGGVIKFYIVASMDDEPAEFAIEYTEATKTIMLGLYTSEMCQAIEYTITNEDVDKLVSDFSYDDLLDLIESSFKAYAGVEISEYVNLDAIAPALEKGMNKLKTDEAVEKVWNFEYKDDTYSFEFELVDVLKTAVGDLRDAIVDDETKKSFTDELNSATEQVPSKIAITVKDEKVTKIAVSSSDEENEVSFGVTTANIGATKIAYSVEMKEAIENAEQITNEMIMGIVEQLMSTDFVPTTTDEYDVFAQSAVEELECKDNTVIVIYTNDFSVLQYLVEDGTAKLLEKTSEYYDVYMNYDSDNSITYDECTVAVYGKCKPKKDYTGKTLTMFDKYANTACEKYVDEYGEIADGTYIMIVADTKTEPAVYIINNGEAAYLSVTDEMRTEFLSNSEALWCKLYKSGKDYYWGVYAEDVMCDMAYSYISEAYELLVDEEIDISQGALFEWKSGEDKVVLMYSVGAFDYVPRAEQKNMKKGTSKLDTSDIKNFPKDVTVYIAK